MSAAASTRSGGLGLLARLARGAAVGLVITLSSVLLPATALAADAPGTCASAVSKPLNSWVSETIASSGDVDWYRFTKSTASWTLVTLGHLPADYDLSLYSSCSTLLATSHRSGTTYDEIYRYLPAGTYRVKVVGYAGAHSTTAYAVRFRTLSWGAQVLSSTTFTDTRGYLHVVGEILNNTSEHRRWIEIDATYLNSAGGLVGSGVGYTKLPTVAARTRSPFEIVSRVPAGYSRTTLRVCTPGTAGACASGEATTAPLAGIAIQSVTSYTDAGGASHYKGTFANTRASTVYVARDATTLYDSYGNVKGIATDVASPSTVVAGGAAAFDGTVRGTVSPNRTVSQPAAALTGCSTSPRYTTPTRENIVPPITRPSAANRVALTFDMGGRMTPAVDILNLLIANNVCATIFPTGRISQTTEGQAALAVIKAHPELFEVGNHTMHHCDLVHGGGGSPSAADAAYCSSLAPSPSEAAVKQELTDAEAIIAPLAGMSTKPFWRAPYGTVNLTVRMWAEQMGWTKQFKWDIDTIDWKPVSDGGPTARQITVKVVNGAKSGSVVLMHLGGYETLDALQSMIDGLRSRGFALTTLSDVLQ